MTSRKLELGAGFLHLQDRTSSPRDVAGFAQQLERSGVFDYFVTWDQLNGFLPSALWTAADTPLAPAIKDLDSFYDPAVLAAIAAASTDSLGVAYTTDSLRRGPAELWQTMATLASATSGRAVLMLGAGEVKQTKPYGHPRRAEGLPRMEDILRSFQLFWEREEPFDFDGNVWKMENAWLGATKTHRPKIWTLGAGPKLLDLATSYADGLRTLVPCAGSVEAYAAQVVELKQQLESKGRDPDDFTFAIGPGVFLHDDPDVLAQFKRKLLVRWTSAIFGRLNRADWERDGVATPAEFQVDWHYALKLLPYQLTRQEAENMAATATDEMVDAGMYFGSPKEIAAKLQEFIDAGANCVTTFFDQSTLFLEPDEHDASTERLIEMSRLIKEANP